MKKSAQISLEYLIVVSFVVFVVIAIMGIAIFYTSSSRDRIKINQLQNFANKIINSAESVYFAGEPSKVTITAFLPEGVTAFEINSNNLVFSIRTDSGLTKIAYPSEVPILSTSSINSLNSGIKKIEIIARQQDVSFAEAS